MIDAGLDRALSAFAARPRILVGLDFDGVLAPIVRDPAAAAPLPASAAAVTRLAALPGVEVAVVSGREAADVVSRAALPAGVRVVGSHGAEWGRAALGPEDRPVLEAKPLELTGPQRELLAGLQRETEELAAPVEGAWVQVKPTAVVLHTRPAEAAAGQALAAQTLEGPAARAGVRTVVGKEVVEMAVVEVTKGDALRRLRQVTGAEAAFYAGDDTTDEDAFAVLDPGAGDISVKVGAGPTAAAHRVAGPEDVPEVLDRLASLRETKRA